MAEQGRKKILIVDDEESVCVGMREMLNDAGYSAFYATDGKGAIKAMADAEYSLIFMDMIMPGMSGLETFRKIKEIKSSQTVVLFTGFFKEADKMIYQGIKEGMIDVFIRKPFYSDEIINTAKKYA
ncbi:MAG: response regulator [Deltaproteobacteria bacterium]